MPRPGFIEAEGVIVAVMAGGAVRVELPNGHRLVARGKRGPTASEAGGPLGGRVVVEISPYDLSKGKMVRK
jgi:translation initiation factor IF-1